MCKTIRINGVDFELIESRKYPTTMEEIERYRDSYTGKDLTNYYDRCSDVKKSIWASWVKWKVESQLEDNAPYYISCMEVTSANCMQFTISAIADNKCGSLYKLYITRDHNRACPVVK